MKELLIESTLDGKNEPSLFHHAAENRPLLVALHTWSYDRFNQEKVFLPIAERLGWNLLLPEFRGPNKPSNPNCHEACCSKLAMQDIVDAVSFVSSSYGIDKSKIFLIGASGGGYMALMMAGYAPDLWNSVASFVPITNLAHWYYENVETQSAYHLDIKKCCFDKTPDETPEEYEKRSPVNYLENISKVRLKIFHGKFDKSVSVKHSMNFYQKLLDEYPQSRCFLEIFDGGHEMKAEAGIDWFLNNSSANTSVTG